jgi:hypothetical protein
MMARTMHSVTYDDLHDEIIVPNAFSHAVLTFPGGATGELAPIRVMQGPLTGLVMPDHLAVDPVHNEMFIPVRTDKGSFIYVFPRDAKGDTAPIRKLGGPNTGIGSGRVAVDPTRNLLFITGNGGLKIFNRTDEGDVKPLRVITGGPKSGTSGPTGHLAVHPPTGMVVVTTSKYGVDRSSRSGDQPWNAQDPSVVQAFVGAWSMDDNGDVPPRWSIAHNILKEVRGVALDPQGQALIVSDKGLNAIMTFSFPEIFR